MTTRRVYSQDVVFRFIDFILFIIKQLLNMDHALRIKISYGTKFIAQARPQQPGAPHTDWRAQRAHDDWPRAWVSGTFL